MIMLNRPFDEGDFVDIGGVQGQVRQVSLVSTTVATPDNQIVVVPNAKVWGEVIMNATASPTRRVDLAFAVPHDASIPQVQATLEETVRAHPLVLAEPEPIVRVNALSETTVTFVVWPWTAGGDYWTVYWDLTRQVKENLQRAGVMGAALPTDPPPDAAPTPA
jgi:small conductance mechanosensitive channel